MDQLRDKEDTDRGLLIRNEKQITTYEHIIQVDTRDCIGQESLLSAITAWQAKGGRSEAHGNVTRTTGAFVTPIKIGTSALSLAGGILVDGDTVTIEGVQGNKRVNGTHRIQNVLVPDPDPNYEASFEIDITGSGNYAGGGIWSRAADHGMPKITDTSCVIHDNQIEIKLLQKRLRALRTFSLSWISVPRDIIPVEIYYRDLFEQSVLINQDTSSPFEIWDTFIPLERKFMESNVIGFYSTPIQFFRSYKGALALPNQVTPPPLNLWNPPIGAWPSQPQPYPYQTVPTYRSNNFNVVGHVGSFYIVCSGYGVYDLNDWTSSTGNPIYDRLITEIARKLLLMAIVQPQSNNNVDYVELILNSSTTSTNVTPFGYGDFQRFLPGPGMQLNYQPGISDGANPSGPPSASYPIVFPNFLGNVWGPYDTPGDRFQKMGLRDTVQDLYLNGDLQNLMGEPIIKPEVARENLMNDSTFGINFLALHNVNFSNFRSSTNYNIIYAMRICPNGFGALNVRALGGGTYYNSRYQTAGGIGPSALGTNGAWSLSSTNGGPVSISDPNAAGPNSTSTSLATGVLPSFAEGDNPPSYAAQITEINHRVGWYLSEQGTFKDQLESYVKYVLTQVSDTNLLIHAFQVPRDHRVQSTNSKAGDSIFNAPIRLSLGTSTGNFEYLETLNPLLGRTEYYWERRFLSPKASLENLTLSFTTYEGNPIPLERMLQTNKISMFLETIQRTFGNPGPILSSLVNTSGLTFLFDPLDPSLNGRTKRAISMIFKAQCYQYVNSGLDIAEQIDKILGKDEAEVLNDNVNREFMVRAGNYDDYQ